MIKRALENEQLLFDGVDKSLALMHKGDVFANVSYSQSVSFEHDKLQSIDDVSHSSLGCRIFDKGRVGNSFVNDPLSYQTMVNNAKETVLFGEQIDFDLPEKSTYTPFSWSHSEQNINYSKNELKNIAEDLLNQIKKFAPNAKISTVASNSFSRFCLKNTQGFEGEYLESALYISGGLFELGQDDSFIELYEHVSIYNQKFDFSPILDLLRQNIERSRNVSVVNKIGKMPVIFAPSALDSILDPIEIAANGRMLYKDLSLFKNRINEQIFSTNFNVTDDPFYQYGAASVPFDDEGVVGQALDIIQSGVFKNFIFDSATASKMKSKSTGHATRSASSLPTPSFSNRVIGIGNSSLEEMISSIDYGLLLVSSLGEGQSNVIAGDFSVLADSAFLIENGILKGRVKDIMISGNAFELLKNIPMIENKIHKQSSLFAPHILLDQVNVSAK